MTNDKDSKVPQQVLDAINGFGPTAATSAWIRDRLCEVAKYKPPMQNIPVPGDLPYADPVYHMDIETPWSREETQRLMDSVRELCKDVKFEKPVPVDAQVPKRWDLLDDLPVQACDYFQTLNIRGRSSGQSMFLRNYYRHLANGAVDGTGLELSRDHEFWKPRCNYGTGKTLLQFAYDEARACGGLEPEMSWDMFRDTVIERKVDPTFREPDLPRINAASVVADVQGELVPDNDETRPITIDSFGGDFGEQLSECVSRPIRRAILDATIPALRKSRVPSRRIGGS